MKTNYHTHTLYCGHATGQVIDYVKEAYEKGLEEIGISDHAPNPLLRDYHVRMKPGQFDEYLSEINEASCIYKDKIKVLKGLEVEYFYNMDHYYKELIKKTDYLVHGQHYISKTKELHNLKSGFALGTKEELLVYLDYMKAAMDSEYFDIFAHPDLFMCGYRDFDETAEYITHEICKKAKEKDVILEFNINGYRRGRNNTPQGMLQPYPRLEFWKIVKTYNIKTIMGSDSHTPKDIYDDTAKEAEVVYHNLGLNEVTYLFNK